MNPILQPLGFDDPDLLAALQAAPDARLDALTYGVIGFDAQQRVTRYNQYEATMARFPQDTVLGQHVFVELAPCLNNYLIAGRFEEALAAGQALDATLPYVLTFRMRPTRVRMRLLADPSVATRFILVDRLQGGQA